jgi:MFS family permease
MPTSLTVPQTETPAHEGYRSVLKNHNFLALWVGQLLSQLGDRIVFVAFVTMITHLYGSSDRFTSFLYIAFTIPAILLTAVAGVFVDRWPRRGVLVTTNLLRGLFVFLLPWAAQTSLWALYALAFLISTATQFFVPAEAATIPGIVRKTQLMTANSLFTTTMMGSVIFGFALGDPLINQFSLQHIHLPLTVLFALAALCVGFIHMPLAAPQTTQPSAHRLQTFLAEMREGIDFIRSNTLVLQAMLKLALLFSAMVALCILFISFAKAYLYEDAVVAASKFAYIITYSGVGMVVGALLVGKPLRLTPRSLLIYGGFAAMGLCLLLLGFIEVFAKQDRLLELPLIEALGLAPFFVTSRMIYTYVLASVMGLGAAFVAIPLQALIHELIPEDKRGKVLGVQFTVLSTSSTLPVLIAGLGAEWIGVKPLFLAMGLLLLLVGAVGLFQRLLKGSHPVDAVVAS